MKNKSLILDNSKKFSILNRQNDIYKIYRDFYIKNFEENMTDILEDLYDNNEFVVFNLYILIFPPVKSIGIKFEKLINHLSQFPLESLDSQITKVYKNTGLVSCFGVFV